jgi:uncharacterized protein YbjT (DUF2867 family)
LKFLPKNVRQKFQTHSRKFEEIMPDKFAVTGAFGYTGQYIARRLQSDNRQVITLTGRPDHPLPDLAGKIAAFPFDFDRPNLLRDHLEGVDTLYNTYWVRFDHGSSTFEHAVANTRTLFQAAREAGVRRVVHISITNPSSASSLPYFQGKALLEDSLRESGLSYAILRPTVIFGKEDILINNIAWLMRRFPFFAVPGSGQYRLQPVYVEDVAELAVQSGDRTENLTIDAIGPDIFTFNELLDLITKTVGSRALRLHLPSGLAYQLSRVIGLALGDVVLTRDEIAGLSADLLISAQTPSCRTHLSDWLIANHATVGLRYAAEIARHYR